MTTTITQRDKKLLYVCGIVVFLFLFFRLLFLPGLQAMQQAEAALDAAQDARTQMEATLLTASATAARAEQVRDELRSAAAALYPPLKSDALDTLITGIELDHRLIPLSLSIGAPAPAYPSAAAVTARETGGFLAMLEPAPWDSAADAGYLQAVTVSFRAQGSRSDFALLLDDLAARRPAIRLCSFSITDGATVNREGGTDSTSVFDGTLTVYLCDKERELN